MPRPPSAPSLTRSLLCSVSTPCAIACHVQGDMCLWFNDGCFIGCPECSSTVPNCSQHTRVTDGKGAGICDRVVKPHCEKPTLMEPTLPEELRTWNIGNPSVYGDWTKYHPWRAPGSAPVSDPCGSAGANWQVSGGGETPIGAKRMDRGSLLPKLDVRPDRHFLIQFTILT